jgi:hypothetical protein
MIRNIARLSKIASQTTITQVAPMTVSAVQRSFLSTTASVARRATLQQGKLTRRPFASATPPQNTAMFCRQVLRDSIFLLCVLDCRQLQRKL